MKAIAHVDEWAKLFSADCGIQRAVILFGASWCEPCKPLEEALLQHLSSLKDVVAFKVDVDALPDVVEMVGLETVPHTFFCRSNGSGVLERVAEVSGANMREVERNFTSLFGRVKRDFTHVDDYVRYLMQRHQRTMFVTGTPSMPKCGFTRQLCALFQSAGASDYGFFDIMEDDEVCTRAKFLSNWPTFPQVYCDGELVGGLDVCKELAEAGELKSALKVL